MSETSKNANGGMRPWLRVILVASLALNMLVVAAIGAAYFTHGKGRHHHPPRLDGVGGPLTRALSQEDRRAIGRKMRAEYRNKQSSRAAQREQMRGLVEDLNAVPFDEDAVKSRLDDIRAMLGERLDVGQAVLLDHLSGMSDAERAAFAERLQNSFRH